MSTLQTTFIQKLGAGTDAFEIPANDGTSGQYLQTDGTGGLSWGTVASLSNAEDGAGTDFEFNSGFGSNATAYGVRAWVNFNGTGTVAIRESGNVSSITDLGTGQYQVNFTNSMPDDSYSVAGTATWNTDTWGNNLMLNGVTGGINSGYVKVLTVNNSNSTAVDSIVTNVLIIR